MLSRGKRAVDLTRDHKPNDPIERARVEGIGGSVAFNGHFDRNGNPIESSGVYRINQNLAVARAIGDRGERPYVSSEVEIKEFKGDLQKDEFIIMASDGIWDVMSSQEAVTYVHTMMNASVSSLPDVPQTVKGRKTQNTKKKPVEPQPWRISSTNDDTNIIRSALLKRRRDTAKMIASEAMRKGSTDNICVVVLWLKE